jgi:phenylacetate-CoA ligase
MNFGMVVRYAAKHSPFYRRAFQERGIDASKVRVPEDLGEFFTEAKDLAARPEEFLCRRPAIVFESSGTGGHRKSVYFGPGEMRHRALETACGFYAMGITRQDRVANAFDFSIWIPGLSCHHGLVAAGVFSQAFGKIDPLEVYRRLKPYGFTVVLGEPTWLIRLTELAEKHGTWPLKLIVAGGEHMPDGAIKWMESVWKPAKVKLTYGSVEAGGGIGYQPYDCSGWFHYDALDFFLECRNPSDEGYGELVLTTLWRRTMPLIRYRTSDVARMIDEPCSCGLKLPRISLIRGRCDEMVVAACGVLYPQMFERILGPLEGCDISRDWQVAMKMRGLREVMEIHVESAAGKADELRQMILKRISREYPDVTRHLSMDIYDLHVLVHPPGSLRGDRKLKRIVDARQTQRKVPAASVCLENTAPVP